MKDKFLLVSLDDEESKELAQVLSNPTSRKLLDALSEKKATESDLAKKLGIPLSTVHYNLRQLVKAKLVEVKEFHYSAKGKEVNHYSLANKTVIIAPKQQHESMLAKLKSIIPAVLLVGVIGFIVKWIQGSPVSGAFQKTILAASAPAQASVAEAMPKMAMVAEEAVESTKPVADYAIDPVTTGDWLGHVFQETSLIWWFLGGAILMIIFYLLFEWIRKGWKK